MQGLSWVNWLSRAIFGFIHSNQKWGWFIHVCIPSLSISYPPVCPCSLPDLTGLERWSRPTGACLGSAQSSQISDLESVRGTNMRKSRLVHRASFLSSSMCRAGCWITQAYTPKHTHAFPKSSRWVTWGYITSPDCFSIRWPVCVCVWLPISSARGRSSPSCDSDLW